MSAPRYIRRNGKRYYLYDKYDTWKEAYNVARYYKKRNKSKYYILQIEDGLWFPQDRYCLYLSKVMKVW